MMFSSNTCRFVLFYFLSLSANAETDTIRGVHCKLLGPDEVALGSAAYFAILAKSGISTVPASVITGHIGVSPIAATAMTGFSFTAIPSGIHSTSTQVTGNAYAASSLGDTPKHLTTAVSNMQTAYADAAGRNNPDALNHFGGALATLTLPPGLYKFTSDVTIASESLTFQGSATDTWIIQTSGSLILGKGIEVILEDGALAKNIVWQVAENVEVGAGAHMEGILLVKNAVAFRTGSSLNGRILAQTAVSLDQATITQPDSPELVLK
jgi:hypothetical protein